MDLKQAANGAANVPAPFVPRVISSDTEGTFMFGTFDFNLPVAKFLALAAKAGHHVFIVTKRGGYEGALDNVRLSFRFAERAVKESFASVRVAYKDELNDILKQEQLGNPWVSFEDDMKQLQGPGAYAAPVFAEEVVNPQTDRNPENMRLHLENLKFYAKELGFLPEFEAYLREQQTSPAPAPKSP